MQIKVIEFFHKLQIFLFLLLQFYTLELYFSVNLK